MARHRIKHYLEYIPMMITLSVVRLLPYRMGVSFGAFLGWVAWSILGIRKKVALKNLKLCFKEEYSDTELKKIGLESYKNFGRSVLEYALIPKLRDGKIMKFVEIKNRENFDEVIGEGKGTIGVTGHFGSWEVMGAALSYTWSGYVDFLVGEQHNLLVDNMMNKHRRMMGIGIIKLGVAARGILQSVKAGKMVAMLSDQDAREDGVVVDFFGNPASTPKGPAAFALKTGKPLSSGYMIRKGSSIYHEFICMPSIPVQSTGNREEDIRNYTQKYTKILEGFVREYPDHWFWAHRKFKSTIEY
ncbi:MAG: hypothetical protein GF307_05005 [candidate division Zixibacteria bacterium]|nr:hypothetical protein [candidate division Zixibacteria bacterium]